MNKVLRRIAEKGCCICGQESQAHHIMGGSVAALGISKGMALRTPDELAIPLCNAHHSELHKDVTSWESAYGTQMLHLWQTSGITIEQAIAISQKPKERKKYKRPHKLLAPATVKQV